MQRRWVVAERIHQVLHAWLQEEDRHFQLHFLSWIVQRDLRQGHPAAELILKDTTGNRRDSMKSSLNYVYVYTCGILLTTLLIEVLEEGHSYDNIKTLRAFEMRMLNT